MAWGCLYEVSFPAKLNVFNSVSGQSLELFPSSIPKWNSLQVLFYYVVLIEIKFPFRWKMLCKHYPKMKSSESTHLRMRMQRKRAIRIVAAAFELQSKLPCAKHENICEHSFMFKETECIHLSVFSTEANNKRLRVFRSRFIRDVYKKIFSIKKGFL